jgi:hypothetical protein
LAKVWQQAMDYGFLRSEGIRHLEQIADEVWTDYNAHDPGITILEQLCYALTDLGYRTGYELPDLLSRKGEDTYASIYTPAQILPTSPVTIADLRRLVIDVPGVKNAWIESVDEPSATFNATQGEVSSLVRRDSGSGVQAPNPNVSEIRVNGLLRVRIERSARIDIDGSAIRQEVARRLHRCRGLGLDFEAIVVFDHQPVRLGATLEIDVAEDASALLASVYQSIAAYLSPPVPFYTLQEILQRYPWVDEIFEGPLLEHGFIDPEEFSKIERRTSVHISDLIHAFTAVPGILAIKNLHFLTADGKPLADWLLDIDTDKTPRFALEDSSIRLEKRGVPVDQSLLDAAQELFEKRSKKAANPDRLAADERDLRPRPGRDRKVANYHSVQQQFPVVYGIGAAGLPQSASIERKALAKQLKAYLMFYDQLLANQFSQLANVGKLFSFHDETPDSYFSQPVQDDGTLGLDGIRESGPDRHRELLQQMTEASSESDDSVEKPGLRRRNRFLDHLLARFGEQFHEYTLSQSAGADTAGEMMPAERLARDKRAFLRDYPRIGRDRGVALDYLEEADEDNISGLELTLRRKLGISEPEERFYLVEHILLRPMPGDENQHAPLSPMASDKAKNARLFRAAKARDPYSLQISFVFPNWGRYANGNFRDLVEQTVREDTPAHLTAYVLWKDEGAMQTFESAYAVWLQRLRIFRRVELGIES